MNPYRTTLMGMPLDLGIDSDAVVEKLESGGVLLSYLNPFAWKVSGCDRHYRKNLEAMDMVVCDGLAIRKAAKKFLQKLTPIISLDDSGIAPRYFKSFRDRGSAICLVGGQEAQLDLVTRSLKKQYPGINLLSAFSGFDEGPATAKAFILDTQPEVVLVGMGMGLQEDFLVSLRAGGWSGTGIAVGAYFDRLARPQHDYPQWSRKHNIRFLGNLSRRPIYYLRRYGVDYLPFLKQYVMHAMGRKGSME